MFNTKLIISLFEHTTNNVATGKHGDKPTSIFDQLQAHFPAWSDIHPFV